MVETKRKSLFQEFIALFKNYTPLGLSHIWNKKDSFEVKKFNDETKTKLIEAGYDIITLDGISKDALTFSPNSGIIFLTKDEIPNGNGLSGEYAIPKDFLKAPTNEEDSLAPGTLTVENFEELARNQITETKIEGISIFTPDVITTGELISRGLVKPDQYLEVEIPTSTVVPIKFGKNFMPRRLTYEIFPNTQEKFPKQVVKKEIHGFEKYIYLVKPQ